MEPFPQEDLVCRTCGDKGITNAYVYCGKCLQAVVHRYCLLVMPKTVDECVIWHCEDCKVEILQSKKEDARTEEIICKKYITEHEGGYNNERKWVFPCHIPKKQRTNRKKFGNILVSKKREDYNIQNGLKIGAQDSMKHSSDAISLAKRYPKIKKDVVYPTKDQVDGFPPSCKHERLDSDSPQMVKESDKATHDECNDETATNVCQSVDSDKIDYYRYTHTHPVRDPIWRGNIAVQGTSNDLLKGFVAHFSNKACHPVIQEAKMLPALLHLEMHPKSSLWPKSFKESPPSDDKIGLYFFSGDPINEKAYDSLVLNMMDDGLAMKTSTKNAELLIFTSINLPPLFWRVEGKYYLWGVFRGKRNVHTSQDSSIDIKKMLKRVKTLDACSPRSPLSNNGDNGGVDMDESGD